jgi:hypothetical protein
MLLIGLIELCALRLTITNLCRDMVVLVRDKLVNDCITLAYIVMGLEKDKERGNVCHAMDLCSRCMGSLNHCQKAINQVFEV